MDKWTFKIAACAIVLAMLGIMTASSQNWCKQCFYKTRCTEPGEAAGTEFCGSYEHDVVKCTDITEKKWKVGPTYCYTYSSATMNPGVCDYGPCY